MTDILELINNKQWELAYKKLKNPTEEILDGNSILHIASIRGDKDGIYKLIKLGADINLANSDGDNIIHLLFKNGFDKISQDIYLKYPQLLFKCNSTLLYPIIYCIDRINTFESCLNYIKKNGNIQIINKVSLFNENIVTMMIKKNNIEYNKILLELIDDIDFDKPKLQPVLISAIESNNKIAEDFIKKNKGLDIKNSEYLLPINIASKLNKNDIVKIILEVNSDITYGGIDNEFLPINIAINNKNIDLLKILMKYCKDFMIIDKYKNTYLHYIIFQLINNNLIDIDIVKFFIKNSDLDYPNIDNITPQYLLNELISTKKYYKSKIKLNKKRKMDLALKVDVNIIENNKKFNSGLFNSDIIHNMLYILYIIKKYDTIGIPSEKFNKKIYVDDLLKIKMQNIPYDKYYKIIYDYISDGTVYLYQMLPSVILWRNKNLYYIHPRIESILENLFKSKKRFYMIKITLIVSSQYTHANILLIDSENFTVRRFEPYGISDVNDEIFLDRLLGDLISKIFKKKIKYYRPGDYLSGLRFQSISNDGDSTVKKMGDPGGYCLAWCLWYIELKLNNPDIEEEDLLKLASEKIIKKYKSTENPYLYFIRDYARHLNDEKDKILLKLKIPKNEIYDIEYKNSNIKIISKYINNYKFIS
jgi:ankyrin repeat protein